MNQASLTGESLPVSKRPGSPVFAGAVVEEGECIVCVEKAVGSGRYDRVVRMIEESEKLKFTAEDTRCAVVITVLLACICLTRLFVPGLA